MVVLSQTVQFLSSRCVLSMRMGFPQFNPLGERLTATSPIRPELEFRPARGKVEINHCACLASYATEGSAAAP